MILVVIAARLSLLLSNPLDGPSQRIPGVSGGCLDRRRCLARYSANLFGSSLTPSYHLPHLSRANCRRLSSVVVRTLDERPCLATPSCPHINVNHCLVMMMPVSSLSASSCCLVVIAEMEGCLSHWLSVPDALCARIHRTSGVSFT